MTSYGGRQPQESSECDSTTDYTFRGTERSISNTASYPVEHPNYPSIDPSLEKTLPSLDGSFPKEKGEDSTYQPQTTHLSSPPAYSSMPPNPLSENHVNHYGPARPAAPHELAINQLQVARDYPASILGSITLKNMSLRLDPEIATAQNWKEMAEYMNFDNWQIRKFESSQYKAKVVIEAWAAGSGGIPMQSRTIGDLLSIIQEEMERLDVVTDMPNWILRDVNRYKQSRRQSDHSSTSSPSRSSSVESFSTARSSTSNLSICDDNKLTFGRFDSLLSQTEEFKWKESTEVANDSAPVQVPKVTRGVAELRYDAFVLCNVADKDFIVNQFMPKVEEKAGLRLCLAERDIPPGSLKFPEQMDYMFSRSRKLVVILSDEFFRSREHEWQSNLAISQDPASRKQRIIPVKYKKIAVENIFDYLGCCDLTKSLQEDWFWNKIINGIRS